MSWCHGVPSSFMTIPDHHTMHWQKNSAATKRLNPIWRGLPIARAMTRPHKSPHSQGPRLHMSPSETGGEPKARTLERVICPFAVGKQLKITDITKTLDCAQQGIRLRAIEPVSWLGDVVRELSTARRDTAPQEMNPSLTIQSCTISWYILKYRNYTLSCWTTRIAVDVSTKLDVQYPNSIDSVNWLMTTLTIPRRRVKVVAPFDRITSVNRSSHVT